MNDPNKVINVNLSSLLSLKAELLRKKSEVSKTKSTRAANEIVPNKSSGIGNKSKQNSVPNETTTQKDEKRHKQKTEDLEDVELLQKSQRTLQAKSKYYERMMRSGGKLNSDDNCLVLFNRKKQEGEDENEPAEQSNRIRKNSSSSSDGSDGDSDNEHYKKEEDDDADWVEYTDCLGRTRKCLRKDLENCKKRDAELAASMPERLDQTKANWMLNMPAAASTTTEPSERSYAVNAPESFCGESVSVMSKHDEQRLNWEKKDEENLNKHNVHYQDVFFDEARQHGVGYYAFSTDEEERAKQQRELEEMRQKTFAEQEHREKLRQQREKIIAERVRAAKNRQRARLGLPPLEEAEITAEEKQKEEQETKEQRKERKRLEKQQRKQAKLEAEREQQRKQHVRPWDKNKTNGKPGPEYDESDNDSDASDGSDKDEAWQYVPEREPMSQEQWNEHKRNERNPEFAPVPQRPMRTNFSSMPPPPPAVPVAAHYQQQSYAPAGRDFANYQSTKEQRHFQRRSYQQDETIPAAAQALVGGATIPPPVHLYDNDHTAPVPKKARAQNELERSIEAGLRFLRNNCDKGSMSTKSTWTAKADY